MKIIELKGCPFCEGEAVLTTKGNDHTNKRSSTVTCKGCRANIVVGAIRNPLQWTVDSVSELWNRRVKTK